MNEVNFDFPALLFERVNGESNKNIWLPSGVTKFVKIQLALDERPALNKARQNDVVIGLVGLGYSIVESFVLNEIGKDLEPSVEMKKLHFRESVTDTLYQHSLQLTSDCKAQLKKVVEWVKTGRIIYDQEADFNESDALINLCQIAISSVIK